MIKNNTSKVGKKRGRKPKNGGKRWLELNSTVKTNELNLKKDSKKINILSVANENGPMKRKA